MEVKIVKKSDHRFIDEIVSKINKCLNTHPFIKDILKRPRHVKVNVSVKDNVTTSISHKDYLSIGLIEIVFWEVDLYSPLGNVISFAADPMNPNIDKIIYHELGHFIDARLNPSFGYEDDLRPKEKRIISIHYNLWDSYIDGRLGAFAPYLLEERKRESKEVNGIDAHYIARAWNGEFITYRSIITVAQEIESK